MKRLIIVTMIIFSIAASLFSQELGDVNEDGIINILDALIVAQYYVGMDPAAFTAPISTGDVDVDGDTDIVDALLIAQYYVGIVTELPPTSTATPTLTPDHTETPTPTPTPTDEPVDCIDCDPPTPPPGVTPGPSSAPLPAGTPVPSRPPRAGLITLNSSDMTIEVCQTFTTTAYLNTGTQVLQSYTVTFSYDTPYISEKWCVGLNGVVAGADGFVTDVDNSTPGTLIISGYDAAGKGPGTRLHLFTVSWKALPHDMEYDDWKSTYVVMEIDSLLDPDGQTIGEPGIDRRYDLVLYVGDNIPPNPW